MFQAKLEKFNNFDQTLQHYIFLGKLILGHFRFEVKYLRGEKTLHSFWPGLGGHWPLGSDWMKGKRFSIQFETRPQIPQNSLQLRKDRIIMRRDCHPVESLQTRRHLLWEECRVDIWGRFKWKHLFQFTSNQFPLHSRGYDQLQQSKLGQGSYGAFEKLVF